MNRDYIVGQEVVGQEVVSHEKLRGKIKRKGERRQEKNNSKSWCSGVVLKSFLF
jgi:hypothetical protein